MIAVDTNILVHAHRQESPKHPAAYRRIVTLLEAPSRCCIPVFCIGEFLRVITHPRVFNPPHSAAEACAALDSLLKAPSVAVLHPGASYTTLLREAVLEANATGNLVFDAQIVALCRENGVSRLLSEDRDFDRFAHLSIERLTS